MDPWLWFVVIVGIGAVLLAGALLLDRRERRQLTGANEPAPLRQHEAVDRHVPRYVTQDEIDAMPAPFTGEEPARHGEGFRFGYAHPDFATSRVGAALDRCRVLVVDGEVTSMRELLGPVSRAHADEPLVVVAAAIHPEVVATLAANRRALQTPVLAAEADDRDRRRLAELVGATPVPPEDLMAGYVPEPAMGRARRWSSTLTQTWVDPNSGAN